MLSLIYCEKSETIRESSTNCLVAVSINGRFLLDLDGSLPLGFVVRLCKVWHCLNRNVSPQRLVDALNAAIHCYTHIYVSGRSIPLFVESGINALGIESALNSSGSLGESYTDFSVFYNAQTNVLRIWVDNAIKCDIPVILTKAPETSAIAASND